MARSVVASAADIKAGGAFVEIGADDAALLHSLTSSMRKLSAFQASVGSLGRRMMMMGGAMAAPFIFAGKEAMQFEHRMAKVATMLSEKGMSWLPRYSYEVQKLSRTYGVATGQLAEGLFDILSAVIPTDQAMEILTESTKLSVAGMANASTTTAALVTLMITYGDELKNVADASDLLFKSYKYGRFDIQMLSESIGEVLSTARLAKVPLNELMGAITTVTRAGVPFSMAMTGVNAIMAAILRPTKQSTDAAKAMGFELSANYVAAHGLTGMFGKLSQATGDQIRTVIQERRALRAAGAITENYGGFLRDVAAMADRTGYAEKQLAKVQETVLYKHQVLMQAVHQFSRSVGFTLFPVLTEWINKLSDWIRKAAQWAKANPEIIRGVFNLSIELVKAGAAITALVLAFKGIGFLLTPLGWLLAALLILTDSTGGLGRAFVDAFKQMRIGGLSLAMWWRVVVTELTHRWRSIKGGILDIWGQVVDGITLAWGTCLAYLDVGLDAWAKGFVYVFDQLRLKFTQWMDGLAQASIAFSRWAQTGRWNPPTAQEKYTEVMEKRLPGTRKQFAESLANRPGGILQNLRQADPQLNIAIREALSSLMRLPGDQAWKPETYQQLRAGQFSPEDTIRLTNDLQSETWEKYQKWIRAEAKNTAAAPDRWERQASAASAYFAELEKKAKKDVAASKQAWEEDPDVKKAKKRVENVKKDLARSRAASNRKRFGGEAGDTAAQGKSILTEAQGARDEVAKAAAAANTISVAAQNAAVVATKAAEAAVATSAGKVPPAVLRAAREKEAKANLESATATERVARLREQQARVEEGLPYLEGTDLARGIASQRRFAGQLDLAQKDAAAKQTAAEAAKQAAMATAVGPDKAAITHTAQDAAEKAKWAVEAKASAASFGDTLRTVDAAFSEIKDQLEVAASLTESAKKATNADDAQKAQEQAQKLTDSANRGLLQILENIDVQAGTTSDALARKLPPLGEWEPQDLFKKGGGAAPPELGGLKQSALGTFSGEVAAMRKTTTSPLELIAKNTADTNTLLGKIEKNTAAANEWEE